MIKSVYFAAKSIDFAAEKGYLQAHQSGCLQYKSLILRGLSKKPLKRQQNDFTTKIKKDAKKAINKTGESIPSNTVAVVL